MKAFHESTERKPTVHFSCAIEKTMRIICSMRSQIFWKQLEVWKQFKSLKEKSVLSADYKKARTAMRLRWRSTLRVLWAETRLTVHRSRATYSASGPGARVLECRCVSAPWVHRAETPERCRQFTAQRYTRAARASRIPCEIDLFGGCFDSMYSFFSREISWY